MNENVIIVAGGKGLRMGKNLPKQFIPINGKPVLMRTIDAFYNYNPDIRIVIVLSEDYTEYWKKICTEYDYKIPHQTAIGGNTRFHSVKNGLELVGSGLIAVHDAARPFVSKELIANAFKKAAEDKAVIPIIDATDSLREITEENTSRIIDRTRIKLVQTPQIFESDLLKTAYKAEYTDNFTDDSSVVESFGVAISLIKGESTNIKITTAFDLEIAEVILKHQETLSSQLL